MKNSQKLTSISNFYRFIAKSLYIIRYRIIKSSTVQRQSKSAMLDQVLQFWQHNELLDFFRHSLTYSKWCSLILIAQIHFLLLICRHLVNKVSLIKCISTFKQSIKLISKLDCPSFNMISLTTMPVNYKLLDGYTIMHASDQ